MTSPPVVSFAEGRAAWVADLDRVAVRDRWGLALAAVGCVHLGFFATCEVMHASGDRNNWHYPALWLAEIATMLAVLAAIAGRGWVRSTPLAGLIARVWGTVLILSLSVTSMNAIAGFELEWFKPVLCTVATFGFMMMAYLISAWFFAAAVWMSLTGVLMVNALDYGYLIHGVSWWAVLVAIGATLEVRRRRSVAAQRPIELRVVVPIRARSVEPTRFDASRRS